MVSLDEKNFEFEAEGKGRSFELALTPSGVLWAVEIIDRAVDYGDIKRVAVEANFISNDDYNSFRNIYDVAIEIDGPKAANIRVNEIINKKPYLGEEGVMVYRNEVGRTRFCFNVRRKSRPSPPN